MSPHFDAVLPQIAQPDPAWGLGLGGAVFLVSVGALWASVHLRGKTHGRLRQSVDIAFAGLTERAVETLRILQMHLNDVLPEAHDPFDPLDVVVDPSSVERPAKQGIRVLKERHRIHRQFKALLVICSLLKYVAVAFTGLVLLSTCLYFFAYATPSTWQGSCWLTASVGLSAGVLVVLYSFLDAKIQGSIEHADPIQHQSSVVAQ